MMVAKRNNNNHKPSNNKKVPPGFIVDEDRPVLRRKWPTRTDLLAWWIKYKIEHAKLEHLEEADIIKGWLLEFHRITDMGAHVELYGFCPEFRIEFKSPRDYGPGGGVGIGRTSG